MKWNEVKIETASEAVEAVANILTHQTCKQAKRTPGRYC